MKLTFNSKALEHSLDTIIKVVPSKPVRPICGCIIIELDKGYLFASASDGEVVAKTRIADFKTEDKEGKLAIPAKTLYDIVKMLPDTPVVISNEKETTATIDWGRGNSVLPLMPIEEFMPILEPENALTISITPDELLRAIKHCLPAVGDDEMRPVMNGVCFKEVDGRLYLAATDARILSVWDITACVKDSWPNAAFVVSDKVATIMKGIATEGKKDGIESIVISSDGRKCSVKMDNYYLHAVCVSGKFPAFEKVIPRTNDKMLTIGRQELMSAIKLVSVCADTIDKTLKLKVSSDATLNIQSQDLRFSVSAKHSVKGESFTSDADFEIALKTLPLTCLLQSIESETINISFNTNVTPALITPIADKYTSEPFEAIIMPVQAK